MLLKRSRIRRFIIGVAWFVATTLAGKAALQVFNLAGWHPEDWVAQKAYAVLSEIGKPGPQALDTAKWVMAAVAGLFFAWFIQRRSAAPAKDGAPKLTDELIQIHDAARLVYEALERAGVKDSVIQGNYSSPEIPLNHFKYDFLTRGVPLFGKRPPSTLSLQIPADEISKRTLAPVSGESRLVEAHNRSHIVYDDVSIRRGDLDYVIEELKARDQNDTSRPRTMTAHEHIISDELTTRLNARNVSLSFEPTIRVDEVVKQITRRTRIPGPQDGASNDIFEACENLREKSLRGSIAAFGGIHWRTTKPADYDRMVREPIPEEYWRDHRIDAAELLSDARGRTCDLSGRCDANDYYGIWFDARQMNILWPAKRGGNG